VSEWGPCAALSKRLACPLPPFGDEEEADLALTPKIWARVVFLTLGMIDTISPSSPFRKTSNLVESVFMLTTNRCSLQLMKTPSDDRLGPIPNAHDVLTGHRSRSSVRV
jgi:hypothetical protein